MAAVVERGAAVAVVVENRYTNKGDNDEEMAEAATDRAKKKENAVVFSPELLQMYYSRLFPFSLLTQWLSYDPRGTGRRLSRREFSFTIDINGEEAYLRYRSFHNQKELEQDILKRRPVKIDIGAIYSHPPKDKSAVQAAKVTPEERELVFDIDLTDYDEVRHCGCSGASICNKCWGFMKMAVKVLDRGLREDFGFRHVGWFYSGRRGVHAWVCDESARALTDQARSAVASYFEVSIIAKALPVLPILRLCWSNLTRYCWQVNLGTDKNKDINLPHPLHPMLARAYSVLEPMFVKQVIPASGHGLLATEENWTEFLKSLPAAAEMVRDNKWAQQGQRTSPAAKWAELKQHLQIFLKETAKGGANRNKAAKTVSTKERNRLENWTAEVVFRYTYPRLDVNVSKMRNHLLKSPFCVHPKTGRVCVPIRVADIDDFDPFNVPTLPQLMDELDRFDKKADEGGRDIPDWQKTSLREYFEPFQKEFLEPMMKELRRQERDSNEQQAALVGDF
jgi:DNA primase small subunit